MTIALCPGSYDPITLGHLDIIEKAAELFDKVVVVVAHNSAKRPFFTVTERVNFALKTVDSLALKNVEVLAYDGLLANLCQELEAAVIVKGLRPGGDYENELGMALLNRHLSGAETLFIPAIGNHSHIASSYVKDVAFHGGDVSDMVHQSVYKEIVEAICGSAKK